MGFGKGIRKNLKGILEKTSIELSTDSDKLVDFLECITDNSLSKELSYQILDAIAMEKNDELIEIVKREYQKRCIVLSVHLREYPDLFNRRIYIPIRYTADSMAISILATLRTLDNEDAYLMMDGRRYTFKGESPMSDITMFDLRGVKNLELLYGLDGWSFSILPLGLTYYKDNEIELPYLVEDAVGYGIMGMKKYRLFDQLEDSKDLALDTHNPIMDDEEYDFYNANTDELYENAVSDFAKMKDIYLD